MGDFELQRRPDEAERAPERRDAVATPARTRPTAAQRRAASVPPGTELQLNTTEPQQVRRSDAGDTSGLVVGAADDRAERDADRMADRAVAKIGQGRQSEPSPSVTTPGRTASRSSTRVGRRAEVGAEGGPLSDATAREIDRARSGGRPLDDATRTTMEGAFGADFSRVRLHEGPAATDLNERMQASAFTIGSDVFVRGPAPDTSTAAGQHLLAHELAHTLQPDRGPSRAPAGHGSTPGPPVRRFLMTGKQWSSLAKGDGGTAEFTRITLALNEYNRVTYQLSESDDDVAVAVRTQELSPEQRLAKLDAITSAITAWETSKTDAGKEVASTKRAKGIRKLKSRIQTERAMIAKLTSARANPKKPKEFRLAADEIYDRAVHAAFRFAGMKADAKSRAEVSGYWTSFRNEAARLDRKAEQATDDADDARAEAFNVDSRTLAVREAARAFRTVTYAHLGVERKKKVKDMTDPKKILASLKSLAANLRDHDTKSDDKAFIVRVRTNVEQLLAITGATEWAERSPTDDLKKLAADARAANGGKGLSDDQIDMIDASFSMIESGFDQLAYQGTDGKGNTGLSEYYHDDTDGSSGKQNVKEGFGTIAAGGSTETKAKLSGGGDITAATAGMGADALEAYAAWKAFKKAKAEGDTTAQAAAVSRLVRSPVSALSNVLKLAGGARYIAEIGMADKGGTLTAPGSNTDASGNVTKSAATDTKFAGDIVGLVAGVIGTITKFIDFVGAAEKRAVDPKTESRKIQVFGDMLRKDVEVVASLAGNAKAASKLAYQVSGDATAKAIGTNPVFFAVSLLVDTLNAVRSSYQLHRFVTRRKDLQERLDELVRKPKIQVQTIEAVELAGETLRKRIVRTGLDLSRSIIGIGAGVSNLTGFGLAPGMIMQMSVTASSLGQVGVRAAKQKSREKKAESRAKKDDAIKRIESYEHWRIRKMLEAAEAGSRWGKLRTRLDIAITRNWDKIKSDKKAQTTTAALEILELDDDVVYAALGCKERLAANRDHQERIKIVVEALEKR